MQLKIFLAGTFFFMATMVMCHLYLNAKNSGSTQASVRMRVIRPSVIQEAQSLVIPEHTGLDGGTVSVHSEGAAQIELKGEPNQNVNIVIPNFLNGKKLKMGSAQIKISSIQTYPQTMASLNSKGKLNLKLGAKWEGLGRTEYSDLTGDDSQLNITLTY